MCIFNLVLGIILILFYIYLLNNVLFVLLMGYGWVEDVVRRFEGKIDYYFIGKEIGKDYLFILELF